MPRKKMTETEKFLMNIKTKKKRIEDGIKQDLDSVMELRIPDPAYYFLIGDRVVYGNWNYTEILEICEDGKYYKCFSCTMKNHYGTRKYEDKIHYEPWYGMKSYKEIAEYPDRLEESEDIFFSYQQREIYSLLYRMFDRWGIDLNPDYQRGNIWSLQQKVNLIDSIFKNVDIGKFSVIKRKWGDDPNIPETPLLYEMLDGKQRLTAIYEFFIGKFTYKGLLYHELHPRDRDHFKRYSISYAEMEPMTDEQKYRYFLKLNVSGSPVSEKHIDRVRKLWLDSKMNGVNHKK